MESSAVTTLSVRPSTLRRLRVYKTGGKSYDVVLNELMDEVAPEEFVREMYRGLATEDRVPWSTVKRRLRL